MAIPSYTSLENYFFDVSIIFFMFFVSSFAFFSDVSSNLLDFDSCIFLFFLFFADFWADMSDDARAKNGDPSQHFFVFWFAFLVFFDFLFCAFLGMSQLIRSILETCPFSGHTFWQLLGISFWSLDGHFLRPLSVETAFFEFALLLIFLLKT